MRHEVIAVLFGLCLTACNENSGPLSSSHDPSGSTPSGTQISVKLKYYIGPNLAGLNAVDQDNIVCTEHQGARRVCEATRYFDESALTTIQNAYSGSASGPTCSFSRVATNSYEISCGDSPCSAQNFSCSAGGTAVLDTCTPPTAAAASCNWTIAP